MEIEDRGARWAESRATLPTLDLVRRAQGGDQAAIARLAARYLPRLRRWASDSSPLNSPVPPETAAVPRAPGPTVMLPFQIPFR